MRVHRRSRVVLAAALILLVAAPVQAAKPQSIISISASFADAVGERCTIRTETTWDGVRGRGWMITIRELNDGVATGRTQSFTIERASTQPWGAVWGVDAGTFTYEATMFESTSHGDRAVATRTSGVATCPTV